MVSDHCDACLCEGLELHDVRDMSPVHRLVCSECLGELAMERHVLTQLETAENGGVW